MQNFLRNRYEILAALRNVERSLGTHPIPGLRDTDRPDLLRYLRPIHEQSKNVGFGVGSYANDSGVAAANEGYSGGVYSPIQNRIYMVPFGMGAPAETDWHYIDCQTGGVVAYTHGVTTTDDAYLGGVYSPTQNRIYFVPCGQADVANWHYVDCSTGDVVAYAHGVTVLDFGYLGGVYSPLQNRIYFVPWAQASESNWHYIDCDTGNVVAYSHGATVQAFAYRGGAYSPTQNRIYLAPSAQAAPAQTEWHYIDCATGNVVAYTHGATTVNLAYAGAVYSPTQNRIYFVPANQAAPAQTEWHYIDCATGNVVAYTHGATTVNAAYTGGSYDPCQNRIYMSPVGQSNQPDWHYIDCNTGDIITYQHGTGLATVSAYVGSVYDIMSNRTYLIPSGVADETTWHYIQSYSDAKVSRNLMASPLFNKL